MQDNININDKTPNPALISDLASDLLHEEAVARTLKQSGKAPGAVTALPTLDETLGGFLAPTLHTLLAAPGAGKTALGLQLATTCGCPALYVTSEMTRSDLLRRITARTTRTYLGKLRGGALSQDELTAHLNAASQKCPMTALFDVTERMVTCTEIADAANNLRDRFKQEHLLLVIDSVTDWAVSLSSETEGSEYAASEAALTGLKQLAAELKTPIIAIAHRNRAGQKAQGMDKLYTGKATGRYEYVSGTVWDLERDTETEPDAKGQTKATLTVLKNRYGQSGIQIPLMFEGRVQQFVEANGSAVRTW